MSNLKRKTIFLDQDNINRVIQMFNLKTEKDAVNKAQKGDYSSLFTTS